MIAPPRFSLEDAERASDAWGCNCGPTALACLLGLTLDEARPLMGDFEAKRYTNPTLMRDALNRSGRTWRYLPPAEWPRLGLLRIQWEGPWMKPGVPFGARYRQTHWVGAAQGPTGRGVWDINCLDNGSGWVSLEDWERLVVPAITSTIKRADGKWSITHSIRVST